VIDEERFRNNLYVIKQVSVESGAEIILAFKGFAMWGVFPILKEYISGASASSPDEARLCFEEIGVPAHTYSPVYKEADFESILKYSSHVTFNSLAQFHKFSAILSHKSRKISAGLRINPEYSEIGHDLYNPCSPGSRLGITADDLIKEGMPEGIEGLHFHVLFESDSYALEKVLEIVELKFSRFFHRIKWINMGGGHLMTRKGYDTGHLVKILKRFRTLHGDGLGVSPSLIFPQRLGDKGG